MLDKIPVVLTAGKRFTRVGQVNPMVWPNDGIVAVRSALAVDLADSVLPHRRCYSFDDTHSIFVSNEAGLDWKTALTWDPQVFDALHASPRGRAESANKCQPRGLPRLTRVSRRRPRCRPS